MDKYYTVHLIKDSLTVLANNINNKMKYIIYFGSRKKNADGYEYIRKQTDKRIYVIYENCDDKIIESIGNSIINKLEESK